MAVKALGIGFAKLMVVDLERSVQFYRDACGLAEVVRVQDEMLGRSVTEVVFAPAARRSCGQST
jgi:catechol 2,3-dioxygenase-like lactoylglutathione lyase family enzyme